MYDLKYDLKSDKIYAGFAILPATICPAYLNSGWHRMKSIQFKLSLAFSGRPAPSNGEYVNSEAVFEALSRDMRELAGV